MLFLQLRYSIRLPRKGLIFGLDSLYPGSAGDSPNRISAAQEVLPFPVRACTSPTRWRFIMRRQIRVTDSLDPCG
jgi:hypothetical protein